MCCTIAPVPTSPPSTAQVPTDPVLHSSWSCRTDALSFPLQPKDETRESGEKEQTYTHGTEDVGSGREAGSGLSPRGLQHHDAVFSLEGAGGSKSDINIWKATAVRIAVSPTSHPTLFYRSICCPGGEGLEPGGEGVELGEQAWVVFGSEHGWCSQAAPQREHSFPIHTSFQQTSCHTGQN